jgi:hypothetical protein
MVESWFRYIVEYDEKSGEWDVLLSKSDWYVPYFISSFKDQETAEAVCSCMESLREGLGG